MMATLQHGYIWVSGLGDICFPKCIAELRGTTGDEKGESGPAPPNKLIESKWSSIPMKHLELNSNPTHCVDLKTLKTITFFSFVFARPAWSEKAEPGEEGQLNAGGWWIPKLESNSMTETPERLWQWTNGQRHRHRGSSQWLCEPSSPQVHCADVKSFMNVMYSYTLATETHGIYTESLQQHTALCPYQSNSSPLCDSSSPGLPLVSMATVFSSSCLLTSALGVCRLIWMLL